MTTNKRNSEVNFKTQEQPNSEKEEKGRTSSNEKKTSKKTDGQEIEIFDEDIVKYSTPKKAVSKTFRNLLILEGNLQEQFKIQTEMRKKYLVFVFLLCLMIGVISYILFILKSEGWPNKTMRVILKFILVALNATLILYHLSGEYKKMIMFPKRYLSSVNVSLQQFNIGIVPIENSYVDQTITVICEILVAIISFLIAFMKKTYPCSKTSYRMRIVIFFIGFKLKCLAKTEVQMIKLILSEQAFNVDIRRSWELYRTKFWILEGIRKRKILMELLLNGKFSKSDLEK